MALPLRSMSRRSRARAAIPSWPCYWTRLRSGRPMTLPSLTTEVLNALRPGMATIPNALLLCASSPYARRGALWTAYQQVLRQDRRAAPGLAGQHADHEPDQSRRRSLTRRWRMIRRQRPRNIWGNFGSDVEGFVSREAVEACVANEIYERAPVPGLRYVAFVDPSGGSRRQLHTRHRAPGRRQSAT